ncbi:hypothetical protein ARMSODRAFT_1026563 [Armillaria solidipes]|uniref:CxC2-like cysteine cluster KDZ transposase-associated domain-containing protein n=1 Tax=Armillaria solidipes TaxID=1076256 RepID=A0A2H3ANG1_9AGAR|nr:hypothetical protein ARMSODRAFT_1026563 [Armillaria solidipes]
MAARGSGTGTSTQIKTFGNLLPPPQEPTAEARKRYDNSDKPHLEWMGRNGVAGHQEEFLAKFLHAEGQGDCESDTCLSCAGLSEDDRDWDTSPVIRCDECGPGRLECVRCSVSRHRCMPLHRIKCWNGSYFVKDSLRDCGLRVQLGHADMCCRSPEAAAANFTVLHVNGIHKVAVDFCGCIMRVPLRIQCLRFLWYPATTRRPRSCTTIAILRLFHTQTLAGKILVFKFYRGLNHMSDNTDVDVPKTHYRSFFRMVRQYHHLCLMKRFGCGHVENSIDTTGPEELALRCLACPQPGVNLPEGWEKAPPEEWYIYHPILGLDTNFRLSNLKKSDEEVDPGLHTGLAYYVDHESYLGHVRKYATQKDISSCSGFRTLAYAESKSNKGLRATGVGLCMCMHHEMVVPLAAGDLQIGKRYCNMDYIAGSAVQTFDKCKEIFFSYDIACQWKVKLWDHMKELPDQVCIRPDLLLDFGVLKLHCKAHKYACQCQFSMNLKKGVGRMDGEGIERTWDDLNLCASLMKEMGPGARHDIIDDQFGGHNWRKTTRIGDLLHTHLELAMSQYARQAGIHMVFTDSLPMDRNWAQEWTEQVEAWEKNNQLPNPYFHEAKHASEAAVKYRLKEKDRVAVAKGGVKLHKCGPAATIGMGLLIEDAQRQLIQEFKETVENLLTLSERKEQQSRRVTLRRQLTQFREMQAAYMPGSASILQSLPVRMEGSDVESEQLLLPSALSPLQRMTGLKGDVADMEEQLCEAQCLDVLDTIRGIMWAQ